MFVVVIIGAILIIWGVLTVITGKIPLIKNYHGVKKIALDCQIKGSALVFVGIILICFYYLQVQPVTMIVSLLGIGVISVGLEVVLKTI